MPPLLSITSHFFLQIAVILLTYRLLWPLFRRLAQVQVVAIMVAGFLLGPSVLGWIWPAAQQWLFPTKLTIGAETFTHPNLTAIYVVGQLGLVLYMFLVGASFKLDILGAHVRQAGVTSAAGIGVPLVLGGLVGWWMVEPRRILHGQGRALAGRAVRRGRRGHHGVSDVGVDHLRLRAAQYPAGDDGAVLRRRRRRVRLGPAGDGGGDGQGKSVRRVPGHRRRAGLPAVHGLRRPSAARQDWRRGRRPAATSNARAAYRSRI